jgi:DNA sulfur modification protein DndB
MAEPASFPAIRCHLGDWAYFTTVLPFKEVASRIQRAKEINSNPGLDNMIQRELGERVGDIANYLRTQTERFFSAIVVGVYGEPPDWFPLDLDETSDPQPTNLSEWARDSLGILQLSGNERLFAVDGQHRVEGIKEALSENPALESEELVVLFVAHQATPEGIARTRRLFTTLNKYAKPVTTSEIIALDEDDAFAVVTRMIVSQYHGLNKVTPVGGGEISLVKFEGAQIASGDPHSVTTIQTIYKLAACPRKAVGEVLRV